jgi:penicillin-binding protein 2
MGFFKRERRWRARQVRRQTEEDQVRSSNRRLVVMRLVCVVLFSVLGIQLLRFQILNSGRYQLRAESNRLRAQVVAPSRGIILDRNGNPLVRNVPSYSAVVIPADVPKGREDDTYYQLSSIIGVPPDQIAQMVAQSVQRADPFTPVKVKEDLDQTTVLTLAELRHSLPGVDVQYDAVRQYADGDLLAHIYGYTGPISSDEFDQLKAQGYTLNDDIGKTGLEYTYEDQLRGTPGQKEVEVDSSGRALQTVSQTAPKPGNNLVLTVDLDLQQHFTDILQKYVTQTGSLDAAAVMMNVHTGEILAMVSLPNYDANVFTGGISTQAFQKLLNDPGKPLVNHAISDQYPPGSTFKTITASAALQLGVANENTKLISNGSMCFGGDVHVTGTGDCVFDWRPGLGTLTLKQGIALSSDIYFYCLAGGCPAKDTGYGIPGNGVGQDNLAKFAKQFGLGQKTGIDLPDETAGIIPDPAYSANLKDIDGTPHQWQLADTYFMGVGEGYDATTPLQMVRVAAAIANGGDVVRPHLVHEIDDANGNVVVPPSADIVSHVGVSPQNLAIVRDGMRMAVEGDYNTASAYTAYVPGLKIAGKTGTAEYGTALSAPKGDTVNGDTTGGNGSYSEHGWFMSFAPYDNPQVALIVFQDKGNGAATAAPCAAEMWKYYFNAWLPSHPNAAPAFSAPPVGTPVPLSPTPAPQSPPQGAQIATLPNRHAA